jgi:hypothetical protein
MIIFKTVHYILCLYYAIYIILAQSGQLSFWLCMPRSLRLIMKSFLQSFAQYLCSGIYRSYQFLAKVKATSTGKLLDSLPRNDSQAELYSCKFNVVLVDCLTSCPGTIRRLNCALVNWLWLTAVIRSQKLPTSPSYLYYFYYSIPKHFTL